MKTRLSNLWIAIRKSFWAIPLSGLVLATVLAAATSIADRQFSAGGGFAGTPWIGVGDLDVVRTLLATVGSAIVGVLGLAFSITITSLVLASSQLGPRLLRTYMDRRFIQIVLATLAGTSLYCFLQLYIANIWNRLDIEPVTTVTVLLALVIVNLVMLVIFIHHSAMYLQADTVIADVHESFEAGLDRWFPAERDEAPAGAPMRDPEQIDRLFERPQHEIAAHGSGYLGDVDVASLVAFAASNHLVIRLHRQPGDYLVRGASLASSVADALPLADGDRDRDADELGARLRDQIARASIIEGSRATEQDPRYMIRQLVEIGARALSPGINDPYTAITALDRLTSALRAVAERADMRVQHFDDNGHLRVVEKRVERADLVGHAYDQIRQAAGSRPDVIRHLLESMTTLADAVDDKAFHAALLAQADMIEDQCKDSDNTRLEQDEIDQRIDRLKSFFETDTTHHVVRFG